MQRRDVGSIDQIWHLFLRKRNQITRFLAPVSAQCNANAYVTAAYPVGLAVEQAGVGAPGDPLAAVGEPPGALRLEVEDALAQRLAVVVPGGGHARRGGERQGEAEDGHHSADRAASSSPGGHCREGAEEASQRNGKVRAVGKVIFLPRSTGAALDGMEAEQAEQRQIYSARGGSGRAPKNQGSDGGRRRSRKETFAQVLEGSLSTACRRLSFMLVAID